MIKIFKNKARNRMIQRRILKCIWDFGLVWEAEIYSRTDGKYERSPMERLTGDTINISEWM